MNMIRKKKTLFLTTILGVVAGSVGLAQPMMGPGELDHLVDRVALYPDPLLAQTLAAASYAPQIPDAAAWANHHSFLHGEALANAIREDQLPWDPSVQALLPFPNVLSMMASDPGWTESVGNAFLAQRDAVMDAVQRDRHKAYQYGYLRTNAQIVVTPGPYIEIEPANPGVIYVPTYSPGVVFAAPRPGFFVGGAIGFGGVGISLGGAFAPWGWGGVHFGWGQHAVIINNHPWGRTWGNREGYVHPYEHVQRYHYDEHKHFQEHHEDRRGHDRDHH